MKKKICILGATGSIGSSTLKVAITNKKDFIIDTLVANANTKKILFQIRKYKPNKYIIKDLKTFLKIKKKNIS